MNSDVNNAFREQLEVRVIAMLLGEASAFETAELQEMMGKDTELAAFHDRMKGTIGLLQQATNAPAEAQAGISQPKLSPERRQVLLGVFRQGDDARRPHPSSGKTETPERRSKLIRLFARPVDARNMDSKRRKMIRIIEWAAAACIMIALGGMLLPALSKAKARAQRITTASLRVQREIQEKIDAADPVEKVGRPMAFAGTPLAHEPAVPATPLPVPPAAQIVLPPGGADEDVAVNYAATTSSGNSGSQAQWFDGIQRDYVDANAARTELAKDDSSDKNKRFFGRYAWDDLAGPRDSGINAGAVRQSESATFDFGSARSGAGVNNVYSFGIAGYASAAVPSSASQLSPSISDRAKVPELGEVPAMGRLFRGTSAASILSSSVEPAAPSTSLFSDDSVVVADSSAKATEHFYADKDRNLIVNGNAPVAKEFDELKLGWGYKAGVRGLDTQEPQDRLMGRKGVSAQPGEAAARGDAKQVATTYTIAPVATAPAAAAAPVIAGDYVAGGAVTFGAGERSERMKRQIEARPAAPPSEAVDLLFDTRKTSNSTAKREEAPIGERYARSAAEKKVAASAEQEAVRQVGAQTGTAPSVQIEAKFAETSQADLPAKKPSVPPATPQPEILTRENAFSTFSLNVSDVSFKLAAASLQNGVLPEAGSIRVEEFINAFNYRDPAPVPGARLAFAWERAAYPFAHNRDILRLGVQTAARGRDAQRALNLVILLDNSGSMERPDRVAILREALQVLAQQLRPQDRISVIAFSRTAHLWVDGMVGGRPQELLAKVLNSNPEGGTNLEDAMSLGYATAARHFIANGVNRVILLTDGAANLGNVEPEELKKKVVEQRQKGIALDCFGIGWEGYNDDLLEVLSRNGDGRYGFINSPEQAGPQFADQLAGALNVSASDVKTQVEFNPHRVTSWRQIGYARHQLTKEQFRDNTVDAAEIAAAEQGNALYVIETNPEGSGPIGVVRVRFKVPETGEYVEQEWPLEYQPRVAAIDQSTPAMRLAVTASAFGEWLSQSPFSAEVTLPALQASLAGVPETFSPDPRPQQLATMLQQARRIAGK